MSTSHSFHWYGHQNSPRKLLAGLDAKTLSQTTREAVLCSSVVLRFTSCLCFHRSQNDTPMRYWFRMYGTSANRQRRIHIMSDIWHNKSYDKLEMGQNEWSLFMDSALIGQTIESIWRFIFYFFRIRESDQRYYTTGFKVLSVFKLKKISSKLHGVESDSEVVSRGSEIWGVAVMG